VHVARGHGFSPPLMPLRYVCASSFMDDVMFSYHWPSGQNKHLGIMYRRVRQVAVPVGHQTTTVFGWVHQNAALGVKSALCDGLVKCCDSCLPVAFLLSEVSCSMKKEWGAVGEFLLLACVIGSYLLQCFDTVYWVKWGTSSLQKPFYWVLWPIQE